MNRNLITLALMMSLSACTSDDSSSSDVVVNTPAVIAGETTGSVDDTGGSISGILTVTDVDQGESGFNAQNSVTTTYGTFTLTPNAANGNWTYELDTTNAAVIALNDRETLIDTIIIVSIDGTQSTINITITGSVDNIGINTCDTTSKLKIVGAIAEHYDGIEYPGNVLDDDLNSIWAGNAFPDLNGTSNTSVSLTVKLDDIATVTELGILWSQGELRTTSYMIETSKDNITWIEALAETDSVGGSTVETVALTTSTAEYIRLTGYGNSKNTGWVSIKNLTVTGCDSSEDSIATTNEAATLVGDLTAKTDNDQSSAQTGTLTAIDLEGDSIVQQSGTNGLYGVFNISVEGIWTYSLDVNTVANLSVGEEVTDTFIVKTTDEVSTPVAITISGKNTPIIVVDTNNLGIQIVDTVPGATVGGSYTGQGTTGQFIKEIDEIDSGTFSATVQIQKNPDTAVPDNASQLNNIGYMTLEHSSSTAPVAEVAFRNGFVSYRSGSNGLTSTGLTYNEGDVMAVQIDWDESNYYISIDGGKTKVGPYVGPTVFSSNYGQTESTVNRLSFRLSNDSSHSQYEFNVDQIRLDEAGVDLSFEIDKYAIGNALLGDNVEVTIQEMNFFEIEATEEF